MPDQAPSTITCPVCSNVNPWAQDSCLNDAFDLRPIKQQIAGAALAGSPPSPPPVAMAQPSEPIPPMPELSDREDDDAPMWPVANRRTQIRGLGDRAEEVAARFFKRVNDRQIEGVKLSHGTLVINLGGNRTDSRDYYCADKDLGESAFSTMAVRIAPNGTDLFIEWRQYVTPSVTMVPVVPPLFHRYNDAGILNPFIGHIPTTFRTWIWILGIMSAIASIFVLFSREPGGALVAGIVAAVCFGLVLWKKPGRKDSLEGFQEQEAEAFQFSIRSALEEAVDDAGIAHSWLRGLGGPTGPNEPLI